MRQSELVARWRARRDEYEKVGALVDGTRIADEILADLAALSVAQEDEALSLAEAAIESGYSADHLSRLIRAGKLTNAGRRNGPRIRRAELPRKPGALTSGQSLRMIPGADRRQIARSVLTSDGKR